MAEVSPTYNSTLICPACKKEYEYTKLRSRQLRSKGQDTDFRPLYEGENPFFYDVVICPHCGFAWMGSSFEGVITADITYIRTKLTPKWSPRSFAGPRDVDKAIEAYKILLLNMQLRMASFSELARAGTRLAWLYRIKGDVILEGRFMTYALENYNNAYVKEHLPNPRLDEYTCMYMIGELARRVGKEEESVRWFARLIAESSKPGVKEKLPPNMLEQARDLLSEARFALKKKQEALQHGLANQPD